MVKAGKILELTSVDIFIYRAKLYQLLGMEQKAKEDYSVAIRINPEHEEVKIYIKESKEKALK